MKGETKMNMTLGELLDALAATGMSRDSEVRACIDPGAEDTAGIKEVAAGCDGVLITLSVDEIG
jgi:hypothetical protein